MTDQVDVSEDLDVFETELFGTATPKEPETIDVEVEDSDGGDAPTDAEDEDELEVEAEADESEEPEPKEKPKSRAQERISELVNREKETARKLDEALARLQQAEALTKTPTPQEPEAVAPGPDDKNEDGTEKYPLGEFDPAFNADLTKFNIEEGMKAYQARVDAESKEKESIAAREELQAQWSEKVESVAAKHEDYVEKTAGLEHTFRDLDPSYGEYLATTIMSMDAGADVLYYLAENTDEAQAIAKLGPVGATIALGRLEASFLTTETETKTPRLTKAPEPAPSLAKGTAAKSQTRADTDDLDAFEKQLFKKSA